MPVLTSSTHGTAIPGGAGNAIVSHSYHRHETRATPAEDRQGDRAGNGHEPHRLQPSPHRALWARRYLPQCSRLAGRGRARGHLHYGSRDVRNPWPLGTESRSAAVGLRLLVASRLRHDDHQRVGYAPHVRERRESRVAACRQVRPPVTRVGLATPAPPPGSRSGS